MYFYSQLPFTTGKQKFRRQPKLELPLPNGIINSQINFERCFDSGKKRGATVRLSNVTVNAPSVLKHEEELESLAAIMPADFDERRKWVQAGIIDIY